MGGLTSTLRTADAQFGATSTPVYNWNSVAVSQTPALPSRRQSTIVSWRPVTAITLADTDGYCNTLADPAWAPLIITPLIPSTLQPTRGSAVPAPPYLRTSSAENRSFTVNSDALPGVTRHIDSFPAALDEVANARVYGGIHFRTSCEDGRSTGTAVARYALAHSFQIIRGDDGDDD